MDWSKIMVPENIDYVHRLIEHQKEGEDDESDYEKFLIRRRETAILGGKLELPSEEALKRMIYEHHFNQIDWSK